LKVCEIEEGQTYEPTVIALGNFDGVHLGHQKLLIRGLEKARAMDMGLSVFLFYPHPLKILHPERKLNLLTGHEERLIIFEEIGVEKVFLFPFTAEFAGTSPLAFVEKILLKIGAVHVVVGFNYSFGSQGKGNPDLLEKLSKHYGFEVSVIQAQKVRNKIISSSKIREYLMDGEIGLAKEMMGRSPRILGKIVHGDKRGSTLGFPTANIKIDEDLLVPKNGVYAVKTEIDGKTYGGMMNIGFRPTFETEAERSIEVHFFDYRGDLYSKDLIITIESKLRPERKFDGTEEIISQLNRDRLEALTILNKLN